MLVVLEAVYPRIGRAVENRIRSFFGTAGPGFDALCCGVQLQHRDCISRSRTWSQSGSIGVRLGAPVDGVRQGRATSIRRWRNRRSCLGRRQSLSRYGSSRGLSTHSNGRQNRGQAVVPKKCEFDSHTARPILGLEQPPRPPHQTRRLRRHTNTDAPPRDSPITPIRRPGTRLRIPIPEPPRRPQTRETPA